MITLTAIFSYLRKSKRTDLTWLGAQRATFRSLVLGVLRQSTLANRYRFRRKLAAIVAETPGSHVLRHALLNTDDHVAVPRPGVVAIVHARLRGVVGMRVIPADDVQSLLARFLICDDYIFRAYGKAIPRRVVAAIHKRKQRQHFASSGVPAEKRAAAFVRIRRDAMRPDLLRQFRADDEFAHFAHTPLSFLPKTAR